jgi:hypothetical protein
MMFAFTGCGADNAAQDKNTSSKAGESTAEPLENNAAAKAETGKVKIKITAGGKELFATLEDNVTTQAIVKEMPMTLPMENLYGREMCYRYGAGTFPTDNLQSGGYEVGDIIYWAPGGALAILYKQNGEQFERQHLGRIESGAEAFEASGGMDVKFEVVTE